MQEQIIKNCQCYDLNFPKLYDAEPCFSDDEFKCSETTTKLFLSKEVDDNCLRFCPLECESVEYDFYSSFGNFPTQNMYYLLSDNLNYLFFGKNLTESQIKDYFMKSIAIDVYYTDIGYTKISESPKTSISDLFSNVGGTLGLFVGISLLSVIEIVEILFEFVLIIFNL
jgi:hypothetical protein